MSALTFSALRPDGTPWRGLDFHAYLVARPVQGDDERPVARSYVPNVAITIPDTVHRVSAVSDESGGVTLELEPGERWLLTWGPHEARNQFDASGHQHFARTIVAIPAAASTLSLASLFGGDNEPLVLTGETAHWIEDAEDHPLASYPRRGTIASVMLEATTIHNPSGVDTRWQPIGARLSPGRTPVWRVNESQ